MKKRTISAGGVRPARAVGVHSGLPTGIAKDVSSALGAMKGKGVKPAYGAASGVATIVFHGDADVTVHPENAEHVIMASAGRCRPRRKRVTPPSRARAIQAWNSRPISDGSLANPGVPIMTVQIPSWQARWQRRWNNGPMMHVLRKSAHALFVSQSLAGYLVRGAVALALIFWAVSYYREHPWWGLMAVGLSMVAMRGCPTCWIGGLFDVFRGKRCERCSTTAEPDR